MPFRPRSTDGETSSPTGASHRNLNRLSWLRWVVLGAMAATIALVRLVLDRELPVVQLAACLAAGAALNLWTTWRLRRPDPVTEREMFVQLLGDTAILTGVLYFSGGWSNPFVSLYLLPIVIAATLLSSRAAWGMAAITFLCYTTLGFYSTQPSHMHHAPASDFDLHVVGMWASFTLSAAAIAYFVVRMSASLRDRDRRLASERERALRDQHVLALGTLAAGAAHQLGTPLATMAVLLREMQIDRPDDAELGSDLQRLRRQVDECKSIISDLAAAAGQSRGEGGRVQRLDEFLAATVASWRTLRPGIGIATHFEGPRPAPSILADQTLGHTLVTLLNNAADASRDGIEMSGVWTPERLTVEIRDQGAGIPEPVLSQAGKRPVTTKTDGHGVGLLIANAALERFGGSVTLANRREGGACTRVELPLGALGA